MNIFPRFRVVSLALMAAASAALGAQQAPVQLAFGYECGDRFLVKNDGAQPVALEWKTVGSQDRSVLHLNARESREIASASNDAVEIWVNGKLVATEPKGNRTCPAAAGVDAAPAAPSVVVRPLDAPTPEGTAGDPPSRVARISSLQGSVSFQASGSSEWGVAALNFAITTGDHLVSDDGGRAELEIGPLAVRLGAATDVTVNNLTDGFLQLGVPQGTVRLSVYRMSAGDTIEVDTPNGAVTVVAPGIYRISTDANGDQTLVSVERGRVEVTGPNVSKMIEEGRAVRMMAAGASGVQVNDAPRPGPDGFDSWSAYRDGVLTNSASPSAAHVNPDIPGVRDLDANGDWDVDAAYGPVWYPSSVAVGWAPYHFGHWAWVEPWGWVWVADEPWGFAPFHYGRWAFLGGRWGWVPGPRLGRPFFAPALVAFADGGGFGLGIGVSAWFPLGPRDPFLPWYHHGDAYLRSVNRANVRGVSDIGVFVHVTDVEHFPYAHRRLAMTVVPTATFAGGRSVSRDAIRVPPGRVEQVHLTPHPMVVPSREAEAGGTIAPRAPSVRQRGVGIPPATRVREPTRGSVTDVPRPLVVRQPAALPNLPFETRRRAISEHPGRPLEPQQLQNLREGRPAGPQRDPEPAHAAKPPPPRAPAPEPARVARPAPPRAPAPTPAPPKDQKKP